MMNVFRKFIKNKFFNKIFLTYLLITVAANLILFYILSGNLTTIKQEQSLDMSDQVLSTVDRFLETKLNNAKSIHKKLVSDSGNYARIVKLLEKPGQLADPVQSEAIDEYQSMCSAISATAYSIDSEINGILIYRADAGRVATIGNFQNSLEITGADQDIRDGGGAPYKAGLLAGRTSGGYSRSHSIFVYDAVRRTDNFSIVLGTIAMRFDSMNIRQSYRRFDRHIKGNILVLNEGGDILFDSSGEYHLADGFRFEDVAPGQNSIRRTREYIINTVYNSDGEYYIVNVIPYRDIQSDVVLLLKSVLKVMLFVIASALLVTFLSTKAFSTRLKIINDCISSVKKGNLTGFTLQKTYHDEVGFIYTELIRMCAVLDGYIKKEYVYKIRQKEMELYAFQAQINPHFLYNSLEAIRMNLHMKGETEAGKMIRILSEMFRNITKKEMVVTNRDEINYMQSYLELFQFRYGSRMAFRIDVPDEVLQYATIKHILQPIVENALVHGIQTTGTPELPGLIAITAEKRESDIIFTVSDDGKGIDAEQLEEINRNLEKDDAFHESIGIYNVNSRLKIVYGEAYRLIIRSGAGMGTQVVIRLKAMRKKELEEYVQGFDSGR